MGPAPDSCGQRRLGLDTATRVVAVSVAPIVLIQPGGGGVKPSARQTVADRSAWDRRAGLHSVACIAAAL